MLADRELRQKLLQINLQRIINDEETLQELTNKIDMTISLGHMDRAVDVLGQYQYLIGQLDSDISALLNLISSDE